MRKTILAAIVGGAMLLGTSAQALVSVAGVSLPINGGNSGQSSQDSTYQGGEGGGSTLLTLVSVGLIDAPLNIINTGLSCQTSGEAGDACATNPMFAG